jgi:hypothetical protein
MSYHLVTLSLESIRPHSPEVTVSYLAQLLSGYRQGLACDLTETAMVIRAALAGEEDPARRGTLLGLLAQSLVRQDRQVLTIDEPESTRPFVTEASPFISTGAAMPTALEEEAVARHYGNEVRL